MNENTKLLLFTGSYASAEESGVQVFEFNGEAGGTLELLDTVQGITNPTFVNVDASGQRLYAIGEQGNRENVKEGEVVSFAIDPQTGKLTELKRIPSMPAAGKPKPPPVISPEIWRTNISLYAVTMAEVSVLWHLISKGCRWRLRIQLSIPDMARIRNARTGRIRIRPYSVQTGVSCLCRIWDSI